MNKKFKLVIGLNILALFLCNQSFAQEKKINFNAENILRAQKFLAQNKALFNDPAMLQRYQ
ncbi:MAG: hypothetical protein KKD07_09615, partial [Candidatus Omnitrophica bacterium]|nr:hypothetical protein [Candidatus Omnitrophota bacterium]